MQCSNVPGGDYWMLRATGLDELLYERLKNRRVWPPTLANLGTCVLCGPDVATFWLSAARQCLGIADVRGIHEAVSSRGLSRPSHHALRLSKAAVRHTSQRSMNCSTLVLQRSSSRELRPNR